MSTSTYFPMYSKFCSSQPQNQNKPIPSHFNPELKSPSSILQVDTMASRSPLIPTKKDIEAIRRLTQRNKARKVDPNVTFKTFCDAFPVAWVFNFLLTSDPIHIPHLSSPLLASNSLTSTVSRTYAQGQDGNWFTLSGLPARGAMVSKEELLHLPLFSTNTLTVGVGVSKEDTVEEPGIVNPTTLCNTRFVSNSENRSIFLVKNSPESNTITITFSHITSMTATKSIRVQFDRGGFCQAIDSSASCVNWSECFQFVNFIHEETAYRACPICNSNTLLNCDCSFPLRTPRHPFDFFPFMTSMIQDFGDFEGLSDRFTYYRRRLKSVEVCGMRESSTGIIAPDIINSLSDWSLSQPVVNVAQEKIDLKNMHFKQTTRAENEPELQIPFTESDEDMSLTDESETNMRMENRLRQKPISAIKKSDKTQKINASGQKSFESAYKQDIVSEHRSGSSRKRSDVPFEDLSEAAKILKRLKVVERRDRNRAAATKCNKRRREMRENMRAEILQGREKIACLREREIHLRKEREVLLETIRYIQRSK